MSPEELVREFWRIWAHDGVEGLYERYDDLFVEDGVFRPPISRVSGGEYVGKQGFARYVDDFHQAFQSFEGSIVDVTEAAPGALTLRVRVTAAYGAGGSIDGLLYGVVRFRDGRMADVFGTYDPEEAAGELEAALRKEAVR